MSADFPDPPAFTTGDIANPGQLVTKLQQMRDLLLRITGSTGPNKGQTAWEAFGVGGSSSSSTTIVGSGGGTGGTPDLTPPPTPTGFGASAAISNVIVTCDSQTYTAGGGHLFSRVYGATYSGSGPLPTFGSAVLIDTFSGTVDAIAENPATEWHLWLTWVTKAGVESTSPAGGTNGVTATTGQDVSLLLTALNGQITQSQLFSTLGARIDLIDAASSTPGSVNARVAAEASTRSTDDDKLFAQYTVKIDVNGYVSGFGLASTLVGATPTSAFIVRADSFSIASPSGPSIAPITPFTVRTTSTTINGVVVPVGVYMDAAYIENGTITTAKIGLLQVDDARIASANVTKLTAGSLQVGAYIRSTSYVAGTSGWTINADGNAEFAAGVIRGQLTASQINSRGLSILDAGGNVILSAGTALANQTTPGSGNLYQNSEFSLVASGVPTYFSIYDDTGLGTGVSTSVGAAGGAIGNSGYWSMTPSTTLTNVFGFYLRNGWAGWQSNVDYVWSFYAKAVAGGSVLGGTFVDSWNHTPLTVVWLQNPPLTNAWQRYVVKVNFGSNTLDANGYMTIDRPHLPAPGVGLLFSCMQLETGTQPSGWAPLQYVDASGTLRGSPSGAAPVSVDNSQSLSRLSPSVLAATVSISATAGAGFVAGSLTWNAAGIRTSGSGVAMTPGGLVGYNAAGTNTFAIDAATGNASFNGTLAANIVDTTQLAPNAATALSTGSSLAQLWSLSSGTNTVVSKVVTTSGFPLAIQVYVEYGYDTGAGSLSPASASTTVRLKRGPTVLWSSTASGSPYTDPTSGSAYGVRDQRALSPIVIDQPTAGTYTYTVEYSFSNTAGVTNFSASPAALVVTEIKR